MYITLFMDVEDPVALEADDIVKTCADILTEESVQATLCIVGEKARLLKQRGRTDVIQAMKQHDIGFHSNLHSVHPTITEYLADKGWEDGVSEAIRREKPGVEALHDAFNLMPSCFAGPGNSWGPQICGAMEHLGIHSYVYAHTRVPEGGIHRFNGLTAYPYGGGLNDGNYHDDATAEADRERLKQKLLEAREKGVFWQEVFLGHPTRILHEAFWDLANFERGKITPPDALIPAPRKSQADLDRALVNFRKAIQMLREIPGIEIQTIRQMNQKLAPLPNHHLSSGELKQVWHEIEANLKAMTGWPIVPADLDLSKIIATTHERLFTLKRYELSRLRA